MVNTDALIVLFSDEEKQILNSFPTDKPFVRDDVSAWFSFYKVASGDEFSSIYDSLLDKLSSLSDEEFSSLGEILPFTLLFGTSFAEEDEVLSSDADNEAV